MKTKTKIDRRTLTEAEKRMIRAMTEFTYDHPFHKPWELLVEASRQEIEGKGGKR